MEIEKIDVNGSGISNEDTAMATAFIKHKNLYFLPVLPQRLNFAVLVQRAVYQLDQDHIGILNQEDLIAVSLPQSIRKYLESAINELPTISLLVAFAKTSNNVDPREVFPVTPGDGIIEAIRIANKRRIPLKFIDREVSPTLLRNRSCAINPDFPDDGFALEYGPQEYLNLIRSYITQPPMRFEPIATWRENFMAERLRELQTSYRRILFVCDATHVEVIISHLKSVNERIEDFESIIEPPKYDVWKPSHNVLPRYLDDFPKLVEMYNQTRDGGNAKNFDKRLALFSMMHSIENQSIDLQFSTRQYQTFSQYLSNLLQQAFRISPRTEFVLEAISSCFGKAFGERVDYHLSSYGEQIEVERLRRSIPTDKYSSYALSYKVQDPDKLFVGRSCNPNHSSYVLAEPETNGKGDVGGGMDIASWPLWDQNVNKMRRKAWQLTIRHAFKRKISIFRGSMESGIDPRRTLQSAWRHAPKIFVKQDYRRKTPINITDAPIVWLFDFKDEPNCIFREHGIFGRTHATALLAYQTYGINVYPVDGIRRGKHSNKQVEFAEVKGMVTYTDVSIDLNTLLSVYGEKFEKRIPHENGGRDYTMDDYPWWETLLTAALNYAMEQVICVLPAEYQISHRVREIASLQGKSFIRIPLSHFSQAEQERLQHLYYVRVSYGDSEIASEVNPRIIKSYKKIMEKFWD